MMLCGCVVGQKGWTTGGRVKNDRGGGGVEGDKGNGLGGQRSGSLASKSVYCNTGCVHVDNLIKWMLVLRDHNPKPQGINRTSDSESVEGKILIKDRG